MPLTSASSQNVNVQLEAVSNAIAYFEAEQQRVEPLKNQLNHLQGRLERDVTGLTGATRTIADRLIVSIQTTRDRDLRSVEQTINEYLTQATQGLEQITDIQNELGKGRLSRKGQKTSSALVPQAQEICRTILKSQNTAKNPRGAMGRGSVVNGLGNIQDSIRLFEQKLREVLG